MSSRKLGSDETFLAELGARARLFREQAALTRKVLAQRSGLSERYLAQLESGQGNLSILLLRKLAQALNRPLEAFLSDRLPGADLRPVFDLLQPLDAPALDGVIRLLREHLGETVLDRRRRIALLGMRGAGKSSLGRQLARRTGRPFIELDREIEKAAGMGLESLFAQRGVGGFREVQAHVLRDLLTRHRDLVLTTGGSLVEDEAAYAMLREHCFTIWLTATAEDHFHRVIDQGDVRPMTGRRRALDELRGLLQQREPLYQLADASVNTSDLSLEQSLVRLLQALGGIAP